MVGYMVTWTTYGSWLQGDQRGYVKDGKILGGDRKLTGTCVNLQKSPPVTLDKEERVIVRRAILAEAARNGHKVRGLAVCSNHVHLVAEPYRESIEEIVSRYKNAGMFALRKCGRIGRIWTRGFDKRFCFSEEELLRRTKYVQQHGD